MAFHEYHNANTGPVKTLSISWHQCKSCLHLISAATKFDRRHIASTTAEMTGVVLLQYHVSYTLIVRALDLLTTPTVTID